MKSNEFVSKIKAVEALPTVYLYGGWGQKVSEAVIQAKAKQYPSFYTASRIATIRKSIGTWGFDCVGLIKAIGWGWYAGAGTNGGATYASNGVQDLSANGMIAKCTGISTDFKSILPGEAVWMDGHIGVYIGDGLAVECTVAWDNKVMVTAVGNLGKKAGYNTRTWTKHGKLPFIDYTAETAAAAKPKGTITVAPGTWNVRQGPGTNYKVVNVVSGGQTLSYYGTEAGWYKLANGYISPKGVAGKTASGTAIKVGDKVQMTKGAPIYGTGRTFASFVYSSTLYVRELNGSRAVISTQATGDITGAVDVKYLTKI